MAVRVLFAGACNGDWKGLFNRVSKVNQSKGPFDALFCFGNFFPGSGKEIKLGDCTLWGIHAYCCTQTIWRELNRIRSTQ